MILAEIDVYAFVLMTNIKGISDEPSVQILFLTKTKTKTWTPKGPIYLMVSITKKKKKEKEMCYYCSMYIHHEMSLCTSFFEYVFVLSLIAV